MNIHLILDNWFVPVLRVDVKAVEHLLNVTGEGNLFFLKSCQHSSYGIQLIWALEQMFLKADGWTSLRLLVTARALRG